MRGTNLERASRVMVSVVVLATLASGALGADDAPPATAAPAPAAREQPRFELIGTAVVPGSAKDKSGLTGTDPSGIPEDALGAFGSGLDVVPGSATIEHGVSRATFVAACDRGPFDGMSAFACRAQTFTLTIDPAAPRESRVRFELQATTMLASSDGKAFVGSLSAFEPSRPAPTGDGTIPARLDPEAIRIMPPTAPSGAGTWWISDEYGPWIDQFSAEGKHLRRIQPPTKFLVPHPGESYEVEMPPGNVAGRIPNRGFESLAIAPSGSVLFAMPQSPLLQDNVLGERNRRVGLNIRLLRAELSPDGAGEPTFQEFVYPLDQARNGVNDVLALDESRLLVLERDGAAGAKAELRRVYAVDLALGAAEGSAPTDVSRIASLPRTKLPATIVPLKKTLVLDLMDPAYGLAGEAMPEKIEGLSRGPELGDGRRTLIVATDNDLIPEQATLLWVFAMAVVETPPAPPAEAK